MDEFCHAVFTQWEKDVFFVADRMCSFAAVLVPPAKAVLQAHDGTLTAIYRAGLPFLPVGVFDRGPVQPVPLPGHGAATHADPHLLQVVCVGLEDFVADLSLEDSFWEADQVQLVVCAVLHSRQSSAFFPILTIFGDKTQPLKSVWKVT